jgi:hypothetical protein
VNGERPVITRLAAVAADLPADRGRATPPTRAATDHTESPARSKVADQHPLVLGQEPRRDHHRRSPRSAGNSAVRPPGRGPCRPVDGEPGSGGTPRGGDHGEGGVRVTVFAEASHEAGLSPSDRADPDRTRIDVRPHALRSPTLAATSRAGASQGRSTRTATCSHTCRSPGATCSQRHGRQYLRRAARKTVSTSRRTSPWPAMRSRRPPGRSISELRCPSRKRRVWRFRI